MKRPNRPGVFRIDQVQCSSGLLQLLKGDAACTGPVLKFPSAIQPWPVGRFSADAARGDSSIGHGAACGNAAQAEAARCEGERRNCCRFPVEYPGRGANGRARDTPELNTAPSSRADIASLVSSQSHLAGRKRTRVPASMWNQPRPVELAGLCAVASSVSSGIYTISRGTYARGVQDDLRSAQWQTAELLCGRRFVGACGVRLGL